MTKEEVIQLLLEVVRRANYRNDFDQQPLIDLRDVLDMMLEESKK